MEFNTPVRINSRSIEVGVLVRALNKPQENKDIDYESLGVVQGFKDGKVIVAWPNVGDLSFKFMDLESVDG